MPYIPPSVVQEVKRMDLLTYLKNYEPYELVQEVLSDRVYSYDKEKHQIRQEPDSIQKVKEMER